jgi:hypothetical protein
MRLRIDGRAAVGNARSRPLPRQQAESARDLADSQSASRNTEPGLSVQVRLSRALKAASGWPSGPSTCTSTACTKVATPGFTLSTTRIGSVFFERCGHSTRTVICGEKKPCVSSRRCTWAGASSASRSI